MKITFLEEASREFSDASFYYVNQETGLGDRFEEEIDRAVRWIAKHPDASALRHDSYRRLNLNIFPYYIPYIVRGSTLWMSRSRMRIGVRSIGLEEQNRSE